MFGAVKGIAQSGYGCVLRRSRNHAMMGHVKEWFTRYLAGIQPDGVAYDTLVISPAVIKELDEVSGSADTVHGTISSHWKCDREKNFLILEITLPVGVTASVYVPVFDNSQTLWCNGKKVPVFDDRAGYRKLRDVLESGFYELVLGTCCL